jgi:hypothetical protein
VHCCASSGCADVADSCAAVLASPLLLLLLLLLAVDVTAAADRVPGKAAATLGRFPMSDLAEVSVAEASLATSASPARVQENHVGVSPSMESARTPSCSVFIEALELVTWVEP